MIAIECPYCGAVNLVKEGDNGYTFICVVLYERCLYTNLKSKERETMSGLSPTQRTIRALKEKGTICAIVEKWNQFGGTHGIRVDLFGVLDIIALDPERGVIGIQCCGQSFSEHYKKITIEKSQETYDWLKTPGTILEIWGWRKLKVKRGGKAMRWTPRVCEITIKDLDV